MKTLLADIAQMWQKKFWFKLATAYILLQLILTLTLTWLPFDFAPNELDLNSVSQAPFQSEGEHWAGTDALGRDVLVNSVYGTRTGLSIAIPVMIFSCLLGIFIGASAGYFGDNKLKVSSGKLFINLIIGVGCYFYGLYVPINAIRLELGLTPILYSLLLLAFLIVLIRFLLLPLLLKISIFRYQLSFPLDKLALRTIEILTSVPKLILILALASFITPSVTLLSLILIITYWTGTARLARAEMLRLKQLPFMEAAASLGMPHARIIWKEALPNLLGPVIVTFTFGVAGLLAVEATLSFLGIGLPATTPSWGRTIAGIRSDTSAWWLVAVPGTFLTLTVLAFQVCSHYILNSLQEKKIF